MCQICELKPSIINNMLNINYKNCDKIFNTNKLKSAIKITIENCKQLQYIDNLPNVKIIEVKDCYNLRMITNTPNLIELKISNCNNLALIPSSNYLKHLELYNTSVNIIKLYPKLKELYMFNNNFLEIIEDQPSIKIFACQRALKLSKVGNMATIKDYYINDCPFIKE